MPNWKRSGFHWRMVVLRAELASWADDPPANMAANREALSLSLALAATNRDASDDASIKAIRRPRLGQLSGVEHGVGAGRGGLPCCKALRATSPRATECMVCLEPLVFDPVQVEVMPCMLHFLHTAYKMRMDSADRQLPCL